MTSWFRVTAGMGAAVAIGLLFTLSAARADEVYETVLGPTPINNTSKDSLTGEGAVLATVAGGHLKIQGTFQGLSKAATDAHVMMGDGIGVPGDPILDLTVTAGSEGTIAGDFTLSRAQAAALRAGRLYIQLNSQAGPAPGGNLWGWLLPEHKKARQDEPLIGEWYLPQGKGLKAAPGERQS